MTDGDLLKLELNRVDLPQFGMQWSFEGRNAIQSDYHIRYTEPAQ